MCPYSDLFWFAFSRIQSECGKLRTRITPSTDTFYAVKDVDFYYYHSQDYTTHHGSPWNFWVNYLVAESQYLSCSWAFLAIDVKRSWPKQSKFNFSKHIKESFIIYDLLFYKWLSKVNINIPWPLNQALSTSAGTAKSLHRQ